LVLVALRAAGSFEDDDMASDEIINFPQLRPPLIFLDEFLLDGMTEPASRGLRAILPISSGIGLPPHRRMRIPVVHPASAFRPDRLAIAGDAASWIVNDILIGERSQILGIVEIAGLVSREHAGIPGDVFASRATDYLIRFDTAQTAMPITLTVTYVGTDVLGAPFTCALIGTAVT
jgi:hypothetical protein